MIGFIDRLKFLTRDSHNAVINLHTLYIITTAYTHTRACTHAYTQSSVCCSVITSHF
jgi:hypothetical protein